MATCRVLVVEDDDSLRRVTQLHLDKLGFSTSATADAEEALRIMEQSPYDVLLTDLHLPGMSGIDLLKRVKLEHPETICSGGPFAPFSEAFRCFLFSLLAPGQPGDGMSLHELSYAANLPVWTLPRWMPSSGRPWPRGYGSPCA